MIQKLQHICEIGLLFLTIHWQPLFGCISAAIAATYYLAMLKINVVDTRYKGSWKIFIKSILNKFL